MNVIKSLDLSIYREGRGLKNMLNNTMGDAAGKVQNVKDYQDKQHGLFHKRGKKITEEGERFSKSLTSHVTCDHATDGLNS